MILNVLQADERERKVERKEVPLFNAEAFREAIINAFVHNSWISYNAPMITVLVIGFKLFLVEQYYWDRLPKVFLQDNLCRLFRNFLLYFCNFISVKEQDEEFLKLLKFMAKKHMYLEKIQ